MGRPKTRLPSMIHSAHFVLQDKRGWFFRLPKQQPRNRIDKTGRRVRQDFEVAAQIESTQAHRDSSREPQRNHYKV